ncbi:MAG: Ig-like domain-containing protein [Phycisphaerales bacterium]|nr:MAG: Ig-like domain-containing protein [Phycisphaerales bacterium]
MTVEVDWGLLPTDDVPDTGVVQIWEHDWGPWNDDQLGTATITLDGKDLEDLSGTKTVEFELECGPPQPDCTCDFSGNAGTDDDEESPHRIYASVPLDWYWPTESDGVDVNCMKEDGTIVCADSSAYPGGAATMELACLQNSGVADVAIAVAYDATFVSVTNARFAPETAMQFATTGVDISTSGIVWFTAHNPVDVMVDPFLMTIDFITDPMAPFFEEQLVYVTDGTVLLDEEAQPLVMQHGSGHLTIVPPDGLSPVIDPSLISADVAGESIVGAPGAILDDFGHTYGWPDYVVVGAALDDPAAPPPGWFGAASVGLDGGFLIENVALNPCLPPLLIMAKDGLDNESYAAKELDITVAEVSHIPVRPRNLASVDVPSQQPIAVAIPWPADGTVTVMSTNPAVVTMPGGGVIPFTSTGPVCGYIDVSVQNVGEGMSLLQLSNDMGFFNSTSREVNVIPLQAMTLELEYPIMWLPHAQQATVIGDFGAAGIRDISTNSLISYESSDPGVATVDDTGMVTAVGAGLATITATSTNGLVTDSTGIHVTVRGDSDGDGDVDLVDFAGFPDCMTGPDDGPPGDGCEPFDFEPDDDVDLGDFAAFQTAFNGLAGGGGTRIESYSDSGCLPPPPGDDKSVCDDDDVIELTVQGNTLHVLHRNATYNCCPADIVISLVIEGNVLRLTEEEILGGEACTCLCCYNVEATVVDLVAGVYMVEFCWDDWETGQQQCYTEQIVIP